MHLRQPSRAEKCCSSVSNFYSGLWTVALRLKRCSSFLVGNIMYMYVNTVLPFIFLKTFELFCHTAYTFFSQWANKKHSVLGHRIHLQWLQTTVNVDEECPFGIQFQHQQDGMTAETPPFLTGKFQVRGDMYCFQLIRVYLHRFSSLLPLTCRLLR